MVARLAARIQERTGICVPLATIFRLPTVEALAGQIELERGSAFGLLEPIRTTGSAATVLCFGVSVMEHLQKHVPTDHPLYWCKPEHVDGERLRHSTIDETPSASHPDLVSNEQTIAQWGDLLRQHLKAGAAADLPDASSVVQSQPV